MTDPVFHQAYETVRSRYSDEAWSALTPRQITEAIYQEIRGIDAGRAAIRGQPSGGPEVDC